MKRLNLDSSVNLGGHKRSVNDLQQLQESIYDSVRALAYAIGGDSASPLILGDFQLRDNGSTFDLEAGCAVFYNNKVYFVPPAAAQPLSIGGVYKFQIVTTTGPNNPVTYQSGVNFNVHLDEVMNLVHTTTVGASYIPLSSFSTGGWTELDDNFETASMTVAGGGEYFLCRYSKIGKTLHLYLDIVGTIVTSPPQIYLPFNFKLKRSVLQYALGTRDIGGGFSFAGLRLVGTAGNNYIVVGLENGGAMSDGDKFTLRVNFSLEIE
jgi:hypothetical protein